MTPPVFVVPSEALAEVLPGSVVSVSGPEGRHAVTVRRLAAGEPVTLVDGEGRSVTGTVVAVAGKETVHVSVVGVSDEPASAPRVTVVQALPKGDRGELAVELLTEVGADVIVPWSAARCVTQWRPDRRERAHRRWADAALAAAKQSRRVRFPVVTELADTDRLIELVAGADLTLMLDETASEPLAGLSLSLAADVVVVVGPEGGFADEERERLVDAGARAVRLGPSILRTSSAGMAAVAVLLAPTPRWDPAAATGMEG